jgi:hypothetical protein
MRSLMEQSYEREDIKIQIHRCYTCDEARSKETLLKHPKNDFLVTFRCFSYTNRSWKL